MIEEEPGVDWRDLQQRVSEILAECGFDAEVGRRIETARGVTEIDVYATDPTTTPTAVYLCECKRWRAAVPQGEVQTFRTVVGDAGAHFGLFVSAEGFQAGAYRVVDHTNVHLLDWADFQRLVLERWCIRYWVPTVRERCNRIAGLVDPSISDAAIRHESGEALEESEAVGLLASGMWGGPFIAHTVVGLTGVPENPVAPAIWARRDLYAPYLPRAVAEAATLRVLLRELVAFTENWAVATGRA